MAKKFNADSIGSLSDKSKKKLNKAFSDNGVESFDDLIDLITSSSGGDGGGFGGGRGDNFSDVFSMKETNKEATRLLNVLKDIKEHGIRAASPEDRKRLKEMGLNLKDMENSSKEVEKNLKNAKFENNFGNRLTNYNSLIKGIGNSLSNMYDTMKNIVEPWAKANDAASKYAKTVAMSAAGMKAMTNRTIRNVVHSKIGINFNMSTEELIQAQQKYVEGIGRNLSIDNTQQESLAAMTAVMGDRSTELAAAFENFGVNLNTTAERSGKMFEKASKTGISFEKLTDNVAKNIKIAQNYTFKNGLKGLESMAAKAVALRMDMSQVAALADKVSSVEGSIDVASKLQVLGGPFASMADPLGMLNEGLTDMEGLMDRVTKMVGGMGTFDKATGEVKVSAFNKKRIQAAAEAMGVSYDTLMESVNAQAKRGEVARQISSSANAKNLSDDMKELIKNSATFDKNGKAGVSINGEFKSIDDLKEDDYKALIKETQSESDDIKDIAKMLRSHFDVVSGAEKQKDANQAQMVSSVGEGFTKVIDAVGSSNFWLKIIAGVQIAGQAVGMVSDVLDIARTFRGGRGGGLRNLIRRKAPKASSKIAGVTRRLGKTKVGRAFRTGRAIRYKGMKKLEGRAFKASSKIASKLGTNATRSLSGNAGRGLTRLIGANTLLEAGYTKLGNAAMSATQKIGGLGASLAGKSGIAGKLGTTMFNTAAKAESKMIANAGLSTVKGVAAAETGKAVGKGLVGGALKGAGIGMAFGLAGSGVELGRDALERKGKIKKGGAASTLMTITSEQAKWAGRGMLGGWWGAAIGAAVGTVTGVVKAVKRKREANVDDKLAQYGIKRKGDYGARSYKLINKALETGNISDRMRRKLEKNGDFELLNKIDEIKKQKTEDEEAKKDREAQRQALINGGDGIKKNIRKAHFNVKSAYFGGNAFGTLGGGFDDKFGAKLPSFGLLPPFPIPPFGRFIRNNEDEDGERKGIGVFSMLRRVLLPGQTIFNRFPWIRKEENGLNEDVQENRRFGIFEMFMPTFFRKIFRSLYAKQTNENGVSIEKGENRDEKKDDELSKKLSGYFLVKNAIVENVQIKEGKETPKETETVAKNNNEYTEESIKEGKASQKRNVQINGNNENNEEIAYVSNVAKKYNEDNVNENVHSIKRNVAKSGSTLGGVNIGASIMNTINSINPIVDSIKEKTANRKYKVSQRFKDVVIGTSIGNLIPGIGPIIGASIGGVVSAIKERKTNKEEKTIEIKAKPEKGESVEAKEMQQKAEIKASNEKKREEKRKADEEQRNKVFNGGKIDVNITGTIRLEANGKQFNMDELMKDSVFRQELAKMISEQVKFNATQSNIVERK